MVQVNKLKGGSNGYKILVEVNKRQKEIQFGTEFRPRKDQEAILINTRWSTMKSGSGMCIVEVNRKTKGEKRS